MCFSATASFSVGGILLIGGIASIRYVKSPTQIPFAVIPLIFSLQQFIEGFTWLALAQPDDEAWLKTSTYAFLIIAQGVWPFWVPLSIYLMEKKTMRRKILFVLVCLGVCVSVYLGYCILHYPLNTVLSPHHIRYDLQFPHRWIYLDGVYYFVATVVPAFISSVRRMNLLGIAVLFSFIITRIYFGEFIISVWCYFAAIVSMVILHILSTQSKTVSESRVIPFAK